MSSRPHVFNIPSGYSFLEQLATKLLSDPSLSGLFDAKTRLQDYTILLPTRRAVRNLQNLLLQKSGTDALLMPEIRPLGDVNPEEMIFAEAEAGLTGLTGLLPAEVTPHAPSLLPAMSGIERDISLMTLVQAWLETSGRAGGLASTSKLTAELTALLDSLQIEEVDISKLASLVPDEFSHNWQQTLEFLQILTTAWPLHKQEIGRCDPSERRGLLLDRLTTLWNNHPPSGPVLAAGSTGSIPATSRLLQCIAQLEKGAVVLSGLDTQLPPEGWAQLKNEHAHPQSGLFHLCEAMDLQRSDIQTFPGLQMKSSTDIQCARATFVNQALWPTSLTGRWIELLTNDKPSQNLFENMQIYEASDTRSEAGVIALALREALETPEKTAMLITPDRQLARRVTILLRKWGVEINDTAGQPLSRTSVGVFAGLVLQAVATDFSPANLLALLKHPFCRVGQNAKSHRQLVSRLELYALRGFRPTGDSVKGNNSYAHNTNGLDHIMARLKHAESEKKHIQQQSQQNTNDETLIGEVITFADKLRQIFKPLTDVPYEATLNNVGQALLEVMESLSRDDANISILWDSPDQEVSEHLEAFMSVMVEFIKAEDFTAPQSEWSVLLDYWLYQTSIRPRVNAHPRLSIMGLLEARLVDADLVILGSLNEGTWPALPETGAWLSRPMRESLDMVAPERRIGQSAHDFVQAFSAPEVLLTRAEKISGTPQLPSRWLSRLKALHAGLYEDICPWPDAERLSTLWTTVDTPPPPKAEKRPEPKPPADVRPDRLSVTQIATLQIDPYAIYAKHILKLKPLDPLEADVTAAIRGSFIHKVLEKFTLKYPDDLPDNVASAVRETALELADETAEGQAVLLYWWPRFSAIADWIADFEIERRSKITRIFTEITGSMTVDIANKPFTLTAKADRIELTDSGHVNILDYKTGEPPSKTDIEKMRAPQMPLEAAIAIAGGFEGISKNARIKELAHIQVHGGYPAGKIRIEENPDQLAETALSGVKKLLEYYADENTAYIPELHPDRVNFRDYAHLARVQEWMSEEDS